MPPGTSPLIYRGEIEVRVDSMAISQADTLLIGDTLALARDTLSILEAQRLRMEAGFPGAEEDSSAADSLMRMADELELPRPLLSSREGLVIDVFYARGELLTPGDTIALLQSGELATLLLTPEGMRMDRWPPLNGRLPVEATDTTAVYSMLPPGEGSLILEGVWCVPRQTVRDRGLTSFVVTDSDTLTVERVGSCSEGLMVTGSLEGTRLRTW